MHRMVVVLLALLAASGAFAGMPTLTVESDDGSVALELSALAVRTTVRGHLARTEMTLTYRNSLDRVVGGDFHFPLPPDAEVSDLGLWFDGKLRHGVAVERVLARKAYEQIVHRSVDPALAEWQAGRAFRLNIFPIPAKGEKQVFLAYDQELTTGDYMLDLRFGAAIERFDLAIDAEGLAVRTEGAVRMQSRGEVVDGVVTVARDPRQTAFVARSDVDGHWYASAAIDVDTPVREATPASHVVILYDASASAAQQDAALVRRFLGQFLAKQQAWGTADVIPFHIDLDTPRRIEMIGSAAGARELERTLDALQPLGATNLLAVAERLPKIAAALPVASRIVLVTDGLSTLGDSRDVASAFAKLGNIGRPLLIVHASSAANDHLLANAARTTGGLAIDLKNTSFEDALAAALRVPAQVKLDARLTPNRLLTTESGRFAVASESRDPIVDIGLSNIATRELHGVVEADLVRRAYARNRLRQLLADNASDEELIAHGRAFTQLTPRTSLLVLETWWDYENYDIPMPPDVVEKKRCSEEESAWWAAQPPRPPRPSAPMPPQTVTYGGWQLRGRVLEECGLPLPGVMVALLDGSVRWDVAVTDKDGRYVLSAAAMPQDPRVEAIRDGFETKQRQLPEATPGGNSMEMTLALKAIEESITVSATAPVIEPMMVFMAETLPSTPDQGIMTGPIVEPRRDKSFQVLAAEALRERSPEQAVRVLTDLAEERDEDAGLLRILARVLDGWGEPALARLLLQRALEVAPDQPQTWRELVLLDARQGRTAQVARWWRRMDAARLGDDWRWEEVHQQTAEALARWDDATPGERRNGIDLRVDEGDDLTVELMFDTGWSSIFLHVLEPGGEDVSWDHPESKSGATFTGRFTFGFGPEIYRIANAPRGEYRLEAEYFRDDTTTIGAEALVHVIVHQRGRRGTQRSDHFLVLKSAKERQVLTTVRVD